MKRTKIIATIGPACEKVSVLEKMVKAGLDVCRLNFSFGTHEEHLQKIEMIREVSRKTGKSLTILQDLQGPKIRIGKLNHPVTVECGDEIILSGGSKHKSEFYLPTTYKSIASDTELGKTILLADGRITLMVISTDPEAKEVHCEVTCGGTILTGKGINLPYTKISLPAITPKDKQDALFGFKAGVDAIAMSFVRTAEDVLELRKLMKNHKVNIPIIAKFEKPEAIDNLDEILDVVDGVMVARGDLADEISFAKVPVAQKLILHKANLKGKLTVVATEMLSSMIENPLPTRAEVSDVANAVLDGSDMVMLSNETAMGKHPPKAVKTMANIAKETEKIIPPDGYLKDLDIKDKHELTDAMCMAASFLSHELDERGITVLTSSGLTARILSKYRPESTIFGVTFHETTYHRMAMYNNVYPILLEGDETDHEAAFKQLADVMKKHKLLKKGDRQIVLTGISDGKGKWKLNSINVLDA